MKKRILSMLLLAAMLTSLAACGGDGETKDTGDSAETTNPTPQNPAGIEKTNYDLDFNIFAPADETTYVNYYFADDTGSDAMTKALYEREIAVEDHLGIRIKNTLDGTISDVKTHVQQMAMTGDDTYQMLLTHSMMGLSAMVTENLLYDLNDFAYVDMTADWWNTSACENLEVNGHRYYGVSDYILPDVNVILFNKALLEEFDLEDPYDLVREGNWTIDKMMEMMNGVTKDNGDGKWDVNDQYGLGCPKDFFASSFIFSSEIPFVEKNSDGVFELKIDNERTFTLFEKLDQLLRGADTHLYKPWQGITAEGDLGIQKGRTLFNVQNLGDLIELRDTEVDFGLLPYPKLEVAQDGYYTNSWAGTLCVPKNVKNEEMVGKAIELLAYYSEDTVSAYMDVMLGEKLTRDSDSKEMLKIIFDGVSYYAGVTYFGFSDGTQPFLYMPHKLLYDGAGFTGLASFIASNKGSAENSITAFNDAIAALPND